eukprot:3722813-Pleurochrysis_carterae.AAC.1
MWCYFFHTVEQHEAAADDGDGEAQGDRLDGKPSSAKGPYAGLRGREVVQACRRAKVAGNASAGAPCSSCAPRARGQDGEPGA